MLEINLCSHSRYQYRINFICIASVRQSLGVLAQQLPIARIKYLDLKCSLDSFTLERSFPTSTLGAQIRAASWLLACRINRDATFR